MHLQSKSGKKAFEIFKFVFYALITLLICGVMLLNVKINYSQIIQVLISIDARL